MLRIMDTVDKTPYCQHGVGWMRYPSGGWLRWFYRAPLWQWRLGLGFVLRRFDEILAGKAKPQGVYCRL